MLEGCAYYSHIHFPLNCFFCLLVVWALLYGAYVETQCVFSFPPGWNGCCDVQKNAMSSPCCTIMNISNAPGRYPFVSIVLMMADTVWSMNWSSVSICRSIWSGYDGVNSSGIVYSSISIVWSANAFRAGVTVNFVCKGTLSSSADIVVSICESWFPHQPHQHSTI
jgi:hypothetical protein